MAYTVTRLINNSYYISGVVSREFETVSGSQHTDGLEMLNDILADKTVDDGMIPYVTKETFTGVIGQEAYDITDLIRIDTLVFFKDSVRYQMMPQSRDGFFGTNRAENITSLPYYYRLERNFDGATIYVYFLPDDTYTFEYVGLKRLAEVTNNQDLALTLDRFYINYLKYQLAERICNEFNYSVPPMVETQLQRYRRYINKKSAPMDLSMRKLSTLGDYESVNYAQANLGKGWTTP